MTELIINPDDLTALAKAKPVGLDRNIQYWDTKTGDKKKELMLVGFRVTQFPDRNDPEKVRDVPCAVFVDVDKRVWENGSAILVSTMKDQFKIGDLICIEYVGVKTSKSGNKCDNWSTRIMEVSGDE